MTIRSFIRRFLIALPVLFLFTGCRGVTALNPPPAPPADPVEALLARLSPAEKVGQMMMCGLITPVYDENCAYLQNEFTVGNFILFDRNGDTAEDVRALTAALRQGNSSPVPLAIALDEEGGAVSRFASFLPTPPAAAELGAAGDSEAARREAQTAARELRALGITWNLAPVADLGLSDGRSYGDDPETVIPFLRAAAAGYREENFPFCLKHFPGIGKGAADTHDSAVTVDISRGELQREELRPFATLIAETPATDFAVMVGHVRYPALDDAPASLSPVVITNLLRNELGYDGVVITDNITMKAVAARYSPGEAALRAVHAGADIILVSHEYEAAIDAYNAILQALKSGIISEERIDASVRRILRMKLAHPEKTK